MIVVSPLEIATDKFPTIVRGKSVYFQLTSKGGNPSTSRKWSIATDTPQALPEGLTLNPDNGVVQGGTNVPEGDYPVKFEVTDGEEIATKTL